MKCYRPRKRLKTPDEGLSRCYVTIGDKRWDVPTYHLILYTTSVQCINLAIIAFWALVCFLWSKVALANAINITRVYTVGKQPEITSWEPKQYFKNLEPVWLKTMHFSFLTINRIFLLYEFPRIRRIAMQITPGLVNKGYRPGIWGCRYLTRTFHKYLLSHNPLLETIHRYLKFPFILMQARTLWCS